jgi:hypothetical protein
VDLRRRLLPTTDAERLVAIATMGSEPINLPSNLH